MEKYFKYHSIRTAMQDIRIESTWKDQLSQEFTKPYWKTLRSTVREQYLNRAVYPPAKQIFRAFDLCPLDKTKVVIVGQDPYHGPNQANGLCFSVNDGVALPPSLKNIYKEIKNDLGIVPFDSGDLTRWASQGVLMLNSVLTVLANTPASHKEMGWEKFTDAVIQTLNSKKKNIVYMLWGKYAQSKGASIDKTQNLVLSSAHPSPFSATLFFGNHHFSTCNSYLDKHGRSPIDWR